MTTLENSFISTDSHFDSTNDKIPLATIIIEFEVGEGNIKFHTCIK